MPVTIENWSDTIIVVELRDDPAFSDDMSQLLERAEECKNKSVVLSFAGVNFLNSSNIAKLLKFRKAVINNGGSVILCGMNTDVWGLFLVTGLDKVFQFESDAATALASVQLDAENAADSAS